MTNSPTGTTKARRRAAAAALLLLCAGVAAWQLRGQAGAPKGDGVLHCALPAQAAGAAHPGMVWVPGGSLPLGDDVYPEEGPQQSVKVDGFWMDRTEVTNGQFAEFVRATNYLTVAERAVDAAKHPGLPPELQKPGAVVFVPPARIDASGNPAQWWRYIPGASWRHPGGPGTSIEGREDFPVVAVTGEDAAAYAQWKGHVLPGEMQWEWAARGARADGQASHEQPKEANTWQGLFPVANSAEDGFVGMAPVGCFAANPLGLFDMIGNAWELTADSWSPTHHGAVDPQGMPVLRQHVGGERVIKGGSYLCAPNYCMRYRAAARQPQEDDLATNHVGFRTILRAPGP